MPWCYRMLFLALHIEHPEAVEPCTLLAWCALANVRKTNVCDGSGPIVYNSSFGSIFTQVKYEKLFTHLFRYTQHSAPSFVAVVPVAQEGAIWLFLSRIYLL